MIESIGRPMVRSQKALEHQRMQVAMIFENLDQNNEKSIGFKKIVNQIHEHDEQKIQQTLLEINPQLSFDAITEQELFELYLRLNLIPETIEKNHTSFTFINNKTLAYSHSNNQIRLASAADSVDEMDIVRHLCEEGYGMDAQTNSSFMTKLWNGIPLRRVSPDLWMWIQQAKTEILGNLASNKGNQAGAQQVGNTVGGGGGGITGGIGASSSGAGIGGTSGNSNGQSGQSQQVQLPVEFNNIFEIIKYETSNQSRELYHHRVYESKERTQCHKIFKWTNLPINPNSPDLATQEFYTHLQQLEIGGQHFRAAAIATFNFEFQRASELLGSTSSLKAQEESQANAIALRLLRSVFQGLRAIQSIVQQDNYLKQKFENNTPLVGKDQGSIEVSDDDVNKAKQCNFLSSNNSTDLTNNFKNIQSQELRLQLITNELNFISNLLRDANFSHPYLNAIAKFLCKEGTKETIKEIILMKEIEVFDRIAFALRFADNEQLQRYLSELIAQAKSEGILECLVLVGKDSQAIDILQAFIDNSRDIQTAGLVSANLIMLQYQKQEELKRQLKNYKNLLNNMGLFERRNALDKDFKIEFGKFKIVEIEPSKDSTLKSKIFMECRNCNNCQDYKTQLEIIVKRRNTRSAKISQSTKPTIGVCPTCANVLPICSVCLLSCELVNPHIPQNKNRQHSGSSIENLNLEDGIVWCQSCSHGGHFKHISEWFSEFDFCPVGDCSCKCSMI